MSSAPPPIHTYPLPTPRSNSWAIAGLVFGILGCVPILTGLLAVAFSWIGLRKAGRDPQKSGRGLAIAGLILGLVSLVAWTLGGGGVYAFYVGTTEIRATANEVVRDLGQGKIDAAAALFDKPVASDHFDSINQLVQNQGAFVDSAANSVSANNVNGNKTAEVSGTATFANGAVQYDVSLVKIGDKWKVKDVHFTGSR